MAQSRRDWINDELRPRLKIEDLAEQEGQLQGRGRIRFVCCPFHNEDTPSCAIYTDQQRWRCYGACHEGGDIFVWIMKKQHVDFHEALRIAAKMAGIAVPTFDDENPERAAEQERAEGLLKLAVDWYHEQLLDHPGAAEHRAYMEGRKFGREVWEQWQLGAAGGKNGLLAYLIKMEADLDLAVRIGLLKRDEDGERLYDFFRNRVIIPVYDRGRLAFLTSRTIEKDRKPKYLHLPNTEFFHKVMPGGGKGKNLVIVEGPFDMWAVALLVPEDFAYKALMGMEDGQIQHVLKGYDCTYVGLDSDGTVPEKVIDKLAQAGAVEEVHTLVWPGGDDAAAWWQSGEATPEAFEALLMEAPRWLQLQIEGIRAAGPDGKLKAIEKAIGIVPRLSAMGADMFVAQIKAASKGVVQATTINELVKQRKLKFSSNGHGKPGEPVGGPKAASEGDAQQGYYFLREGEMWRGFGEDARRIVRGATLLYTTTITLDDGEATEREIEMEITHTSGRKFACRVPAKESAEAGKVSSYIKAEVGPLVTIEAKQGPYLIPAIEILSEKLDEVTEIVRTGWVEFEGGLAYVTPNGTVGELPPGFRVVAPPNQPMLARYGVADQGDAEFKQGMIGIWEGLLKAFVPGIAYPLLAFAMLPVAARWIGTQKFVLHISGETGSLKTETSKLLMSFYGDFATAPAIQSWRSTVNAIEQTGFWLPDVLGVVDDYKPSTVKPWDFTELIQRYADRNDRTRMRRDGAGVQRRSAMRWWMISTGEDIPNGESSVLARMILLRFPRRPKGVAYNEGLGLAQRYAKFFPTVAARWASWLMAHHEELALDAKLTLYHQQVAERVQEDAPGVPNVNRISRNIAMLWVTWEAFWDFVAEQLHDSEAKKRCKQMGAGFRQLAPSLALTVAENVGEEKPTKVFLGTLQEGLDSGRWVVLPRNEERVISNIAGWYDKEGVYILPAAYNEMRRWMRESGQEIGFNKGELYRLLREEEHLAAVGASTTVVIQVGPVGKIQSKRVLHLKPGTLEVGSSAGEGLIAPKNEPPDPDFGDA